MVCYGIHGIFHLLLPGVVLVLTALSAKALEILINALVLIYGRTVLISLDVGSDLLYYASRKHDGVSEPLPVD
jgi:hypothetical protein